MTDEKAISPQARGGATAPDLAPLAVVIVPWLVGSHREVVSRVVRQCDSLTVLAYRDRAARILDDGAAVLRQELAAVAAEIRHPLFDGFAVHHLGS
jgi:hypothetical protein